MAKNTMDDLRNHLFETIEMLKNNSDPQASPNEKISIENAKQITETAQVIINSRKIEVDLIGIMSKAPNYSIAQKLASNTNMIPAQTDSEK